ncbi:MAG: HEAT repeat domain-containing protein [Nitrospira sp.]|nr:HEAT repeat domain-containing protein [Nitrospira sp.]
MSDLKAAQDMMAAAVAAKGTEDPEVASVKRVLKLLDKTAKSNRTYGAANPVALKFSQQLFEELSNHLTTYAKLTFLVTRSELLCKDEVVYQAEKEGGSENLAFKLYADGIRELVLHQGLTEEDLAFFLDALWAGQDKENDDDIVTRLWQKNMAALTLVTAEELAKVSSGADTFLKLDPVTTSDTTLRDLLDRERKKKEAQSGNSETQSATQRTARFQSGLVGYEVTEEELAALAKEIEQESQQDSTTYILDVLTAILASEQSPLLLTKLCSLWGHVITALVHAGKWAVLETVLSILHETDAVRPDITEEHKQQIAALLSGLGKPEHIKAIETYLNRTPNANTEGLSTVLLMTGSESVSLLCSLLANLEHPAHQAIVSETLQTLAKDHIDPLLRGLTDRRPAYVRNLLAIVAKWNNPKFADAVEKLVRHPDAQVRKEAIRVFGLLKPNGNGARLILCLSDGEETVRIAALKLLTTGQYSAPFSQWTAVLSDDTFLDRALSEKRGVYQAIRATCGDEAVPYWQGLFTEWAWTNRKKKEECAVLAAEALGKLATPAAVATLELGQKKGGASVRQACTMALTQLHKQSKSSPPQRKQPEDAP